MPRIEFGELPDGGRLWVFPASRDLSDVESRDLLAAVDAFLDRWAAHGAPLRSGREWREGRFLLVGVDEDAEAPSGCSIDALVNMLRGWGGERGVSLIEHAPVWFRRGDRVDAVSRADFREMAESGEVSPDLPVFDMTLTKVGQIREGTFERPARDTWHGRAFFQVDRPNGRLQRRLGEGLRGPT